MARKRARIVVVGSANVDLTTLTDRLPRPGETIFGRGFDLGFGGKGANQAAAAKLCGAEVHMVARVGDDLFGPASIRNFKKLGIGAKHVLAAKRVSSGVAPIFVDSSGQNRIVVVKGANDTLTPRVVDQAAPLLRRADVIVTQFEIPLPTVYHIVRFARRHGIRCIVNPAPALPVDLKKLTNVDYLIPNETEAETITGRSCDSLEQANSCAAELLRHGPRRVILTLGDRGAVVGGPEGLRLVPPFSVQAKDSTGAGDAFIGALAVFLAEGRPEVDAVAQANLYAALSTRRVGTQKSFVTRAAFDREWSKRRGRRTKG